MSQNLPMEVFVYTCGSITDDIPARAKCRFRFISSQNAKRIYLVIMNQCIILIANSTEIDLKQVERIGISSL